MDISDTIKPKSDQLNADDLIAGPMTVKFGKVSKVSGDQPIAIQLHGDFQPFKPCKSMRRLLVAAWGNDATVWEGRDVTLYNDPDVMYAGQKVGGIRISHMSHIDKDFTTLLTATRGRRKPCTVKKLVTSKPVAKPKSTLVDRLPAALKAVKDGTITAEKAIKELEKNGEKLTEDQLKQFGVTDA
jgi:hypothetical protein